MDWGSVFCPPPVKMKNYALISGHPGGGGGGDAGDIRHPDAVSDSVRIAIHFFVNFDIFKWLYLSEN